MKNTVGNVPPLHAEGIAPAFLAGGGEMGALIRAHDWSRTPLGAPETWPQSLKTAIRIMLTSRQPIWVGWGADLRFFYNDPYKAIIGGKHPASLGGADRARLERDLARDRADAGRGHGGQRRQFRRAEAADHGAQRLPGWGGIGLGRLGGLEQMLLKP